MAIFPARRRSHQYKPSAFAGDIRQPHGARRHARRTLRARSLHRKLLNPEYLLVMDPGVAPGATRTSDPMQFLLIRRPALVR